MNTTQNSAGVAANHAVPTCLSQTNLPVLITAIEQAGEAIVITDPAPGFNTSILRSPG